MDIDESVAKALDFNWSWKLWKTGLKLVCGELVLLALRELPPRYDPLLGAVGDEDEPDELYHSIRYHSLLILTVHVVVNFSLICLL